MTISIAMTTYNGEEYVIPLLDSLRNQTVKPDEVIILDDCSTDSTYSIITNYISQYGLIKWHLYKNKANLGWKKNFREAFKKCTSDVVFLCDQDDIWEYDKIEQMVNTMIIHPEISLLISNYSVINMDRKDKVRVAGLDKDDGSIRKWKFSETCLTVMRPGCTYCARKSLIEQLLKEDILTEPHDQMLWGYAVLYDGLYLLNRKTIKFRRHSDSASLSKNISREERRRNTAYYQFFIKKAYSDGMENKAKALERQVKFIENRAEVIDSKSMLALLRFQFLFHKHYPTFRNMISDYLLILHS